MKTFTHLIGAVAVAATMFACSEAPETDAPSPETAEKDATSKEVAKINWFDGTVEEAFAKAEAENKPVFLYWGAIWCPPCNELKATIFKRPDFVAKTDQFVAVYLDGDTERAQKYGDEFGAAGYPTTIILKDRETEVTRIPGGMNLEAYVTVLDVALARTQPAAQLLTELLDDARTPTAEELTLLAHYSWGQDQGRALGERDKVEVFDALSQLTPDEHVREKARFEAEYFTALSRQEDDLDDAVRLDAIARAKSFLANPDAHREAFFFATLRAKAFIEKVAGEDEAVKEELASGVEGALAIMADDTTYSPALWLYYYYGLTRLEQLRSGNEEVSEELKTLAREGVVQKLSEAKTDYERSTVMNTSIGVLLQTKQDAFATELLKKEVADGVNAYYWMVDVASLLEDAGQNDEAADWFKQAYETSEGLATRAQWGSYYVDGMTRLRADDPSLIEGAARQVLGELAAQDEPIYARNKGAVKRIGRALHTWATDADVTAELTDEVKAERQNTLDAIRSVVDGICDGQFSDEDEMAACKGLFVPAEG